MLKSTSALQESKRGKYASTFEYEHCRAGKWKGPKEYGLRQLFAKLTSHMLAAPPLSAIQTRTCKYLKQTRDKSTAQ